MQVFVLRSWRVTLCALIFTVAGVTFVQLLQRGRKILCCFDVTSSVGFLSGHVKDQF